jgi:ribosomal protein S19
MVKCAYIVKVKKPLKGKNRLIFDKSASIPKIFFGCKFSIYKGCFFRSILINSYILGYKFGEFSFTRKPFKYTIKLRSLGKGLRR